MPMYRGPEPNTSDPSVSRKQTPSNNRVDPTVGLRIQLRRIEIGMSRENLAALCDMDVERMVEFERGSVRCSSHLIFQLSRVLRTEIEYFFQDFK